MATILAVDDDRTSLELLWDLFADEGDRVVTATDGRQALELAVADPPDLIILDVQLPVLDGWAFLQERLQQPVLRAIPVLVVTAGLHVDSRLAELQVTHWLYKPYDLEELLRLVVRCLEPSLGKGT